MPKRSAPPLPPTEEVTYSATELAALAGVTPRAVRYYVSLGLLPSPPFRGMATVYGREHLLRLRAIARLRKTERLRLTGVRGRLARLTPADLERLGAPEGAPAAAPAPADDAMPWRATAARPREHWTRVTLCPGVELHVRADADTESDRVAREIVARYCVTPT